MGWACLLFSLLETSLMMARYNTGRCHYDFLTDGVFWSTSYCAKVGLWLLSSRYPVGTSRHTTLGQLWYNVEIGLWPNFNVASKLVQRRVSPGFRLCSHNFNIRSRFLQYGWNGPGSHATKTEIPRASLPLRGTSVRLTTKLPLLYNRASLWRQQTVRTIASSYSQFQILSSDSPCRLSKELAKANGFHQNMEVCKCVRVCVCVWSWLCYLISIWLH